MPQWIYLIIGLMLSGASKLLIHTSPTPVYDIEILLSASPTSFNDLGLKVKDLDFSY